MTHERDPKTLAVGVRREHQRMGVRILSILVTVLLVSYAGLRIFIISKVHKFEHMLQEVEGLKPGVSSFGQAMQIASKYGAKSAAEGGSCSPEKCRLEMHVSWFDPSVPPTTHVGDSLLEHLGIHFWAARSWIEIGGNVVTSYGASVGVEGSHSQHHWHAATWEELQAIPPVNPSDEKEFRKNYDPKYDRSPDFLVDWTESPHGELIEWLYARIGVKVTNEQRRAAQDFDLKCLTRFGDCSTVCGLLPGAARYYDEKLSAEGLSSRCKD